MANMEIFNLLKKERKLLENLKLSVDQYTVKSTKESKIIKYCDKTIYISVKNLGTYINFITKHNVKNLRSVSYRKYNMVFRKKFKGRTLYVFCKNKIKNIGILTSGGDAPGMNAALRAALKISSKLNISLFGIYDGYDGLIKNKIRLLKNDNSILINEGGTVLKSARSEHFRKEEGRIRGLLNLMRYGINNLILLGGDGSLHGLNVFLNESSKNIEHIKNIARSRKGPEFLLSVINQMEQTEIDNILNFTRLYGVFIPATIDNDLPLTSMTIGADSAMHRVVDAVENLTVTMASHNRAFIVEVMGRNCGYIGLMASFALKADHLFIPEHPVTEEELRKKLASKNKENLFIVLSEGAILLRNDKKEKLSPLLIKNILEPIDTRILTLGHLQRGGRPSAFDRYLGTMSGLKAIFSLLKQKQKTKAILFSNVDFDFCKKNPIETYEKHIANDGFTCYSLRNRLRSFDIKNLIAILNYRDDIFNGTDTAKLLRTRGCYFERALNLLENNDNKKYIKNKMAVVMEGQRAAGMNICLDSIVNYCEKKILLINNGFTGLLCNEFSIDNTVDIKSSPFKYKKNIYESIYKKLVEIKIDTLIILGSSKILNLCRYLKKRKINTIVIPFSISNNIPYGGHSIGCDTALNSITQVTDTLLTNGKSINRSVDIIEVGSHTGYLPAQSALICGATDLLIPEFKYNNKTLYKISKNIESSFKSDSRYQSSKLIIRSKKSLNHISSESLRLLIQSNIPDINIDYTVLGRLERGDSVSPFDRVKGTLLGALVVDFLMNADTNVFSGVLGIRGDMVIFTDISKVLKKAKKKNKKTILFSLITNYLK